LRKNLYGILFEDFLAGLAELGYHKMHPDKEPCLSWRRKGFHVHLHHKGQGRVTVSLHYDEPTSLPPFHRAVKRGKHILKEFHAIIESYKKIRAKKHDKTTHRQKTY